MLKMEACQSVQVSRLIQMVTGLVGRFLYKPLAASRRGISKVHLDGSLPATPDCLGVLKNAVDSKIRQEIVILAKCAG